MRQLCSSDLTYCTAIWELCASAYGAEITLFMCLTQIDRLLPLLLGSFKHTRADNCLLLCWRCVISGHVPRHIRLLAR
jgi:hypothetical protein